MAALLTGIRMQALWTRLEQWLAHHWPQGLAALNPPASDAQIARLQEVVGTQLPVDFIESLKIHNGETLAGAWGVFKSEQYLSTEEIEGKWTGWKSLYDRGEFLTYTSSPDPGVSQRWWEPGWISFTHDGMGNSLCVDMAPGSEGKAGQIMRMWHDDDGRPLCAPDLRTWLSDYVDDLESGAYVFSAKWGIMTPEQLARFDAFK